MNDLVHSPVLAALGPYDLELLARRAVPRRLVAGERLYLAGERSNRTHVVVSGAVKLVARDLQGREAIVCLALPGEIIGDWAAIDGGPQPLDAVAAIKTLVVGFDATLFVEVLARSPAAALALARAMARRMRWISDAAVQRTVGDVPARLAGSLLDLAGALGANRRGALEVELPVRQGDLARLSGMCRESACKTLSSFRSRGLLEYRGRRLRILRPDVLEAIRCGATGSQELPASAQLRAPRADTVNTDGEAGRRALGPHPGL